MGAPRRVQPGARRARAAVATVAAVTGAPWLSAGARTRARIRRRRIGALIAIALLVCGGAAIAFAGGRGSHHASAPAAGPAAGPAATTPSPPGVPPGSGGPSRRRSIPRSDARAIAAVLATTPAVSTGSARHRAIALTFDDGPSPYTPAIVATLVRMRVPATFFVVGQQLRYFSAGLRDELAHGFEVGDHTTNHAMLSVLGAGAQTAQIAGDADSLVRRGAPDVQLFRPPYGAYNATTIAVLRRLHMLLVTWSIDPGDWRRPGSAAVMRAVLSAARPGAIVILHDGGGDRSQTVAALPRIIRGLRRMHYDLVTVAHLLALDPPSRNGVGSAGDEARHRPHARGSGARRRGGRRAVSPVRRRSQRQGGARRRGR